MQNTMGPMYQRNESRWAQVLGSRQRQGNPRPHRRDDAMDVDAITTTAINEMTEAEKKKLRAEGRCFHCKNQGHISRYCPKKRRGNQPSYGPRTITNPPVTARLIEIDDAPPATVNRPGTALKAIQSLTTEERTKLLDDLILDEGDSGFPHA